MKTLIPPQKKINKKQKENKTKNKIKKKQKKYLAIEICTSVNQWRNLKNINKFLYEVKFFINDLLFFNWY